MQKLTKRQNTIYQALVKWVEDGGRKSLSQVAETLDIHYVSFKQHLSALDKKGHIILEPQGRGKAPKVRLLNTIFGMPLMGEIAAGGLHDAEQTVEGYLQLPARGQFALRVRGDSMAGYLLDGDVVSLKQGEWRDGDICAVYVDGATTLKYVHRHPKGFVLRPENPDYDPIHVALDELHVQGVYTGVIRGELVPMLLQEGKDYLSVN